MIHPYRSGTPQLISASTKFWNCNRRHKRPTFFLELMSRHDPLETTLVEGKVPRSNRLQGIQLAERAGDSGAQRGFGVRVHACACTIGGVCDAILPPEERIQFLGLPSLHLS